MYGDGDALRLPARQRVGAEFQFGGCDVT
jgi:hypothetical protein